MIRRILPPTLFMKLKQLQNRKCLKYLKSNVQFKNTFCGKRCFILGNGPSLKLLDFEKLKDEITFTVNQLPRDVNFPKLNTNFHMWADAQFFNLDRSRPEDMELLEVMRKVNTDGNKPTVFYKYSAKQMIEEFKLNELLDIHYFQTADAYRLDRILKKTKLDFTKVIPDFPSVVLQAICLAVYMGFKEIYILGCDCTGFISTAQNKMKQAESAAYNYNISENEKKRLERVANERSIADELRGFAELFYDYEFLGDYCNNNEVHIYNATEGGLLDSYPRVKLDDVLKI